MAHPGPWPWSDEIMEEFESWNTRALDVGRDLSNATGIPLWFIQGGEIKKMRLDAIVQYEWQQVAAFRDYSERCYKVGMPFTPCEQINTPKDVPKWFLHPDNCCKYYKLRRLTDRENKAKVIAEYKEWADRAVAVNIQIKHSRNVKKYDDVPEWFRLNNSEKKKKLQFILKAEQKVIAKYKEWADRAVAVNFQTKHSRNVKKYNDVPDWFRSGSSERKTRLQLILKAEQRAAEAKRTKDMEIALITEYKNWATRAYMYAPDMPNIQTLFRAKKGKWEGRAELNKYFNKHVTKLSDIPSWFQTAGPLRKSTFEQILAAEKAYKEGSEKRELLSEYKRLTDMAGATNLTKPLDILPWEKFDGNYVNLPDWFVFGGALKDAKWRAIREAHELLEKPQE